MPRAFPSTGVSVRRIPVNPRPSFTPNIALRSSSSTQLISGLCLAMSDSDEEVQELLEGNTDPFFEALVVSFKSTLQHEANQRKASKGKSEGKRVEG